MAVHLQISEPRKIKCFADPMVSRRSHMPSNIHDQNGTQIVPKETILSDNTESHSELNGQIHL